MRYRLANIKVPYGQPFELPERERIVGVIDKLVGSEGYTIIVLVEMS
jgi:hypothetical protein